MKKTSNVNNSIAYKISLKVLLATINSYLLIDIILVAMVCTGLYFDAQKEVLAFTKTYKTEQIQQNIDIIEQLGYQVDYSKTKPFIITSSYKNKAYSWIQNAKYNFVITQNSEKNYTLLSKKIGKEFELILKALGIIITIQTFLILSDLGKNKKMIRQTMKPLDELAKATAAINKATDMSPESLKKIAGALDTINAAHLETRIPVETAKDELKSLTMAINKMLERLDKAYKSQARFVSDASHELRTPIAVIQSYSSLLDRWGMSEPKTAQEAVKAIKSESEAMKIMVEQLLFLARGDNDSMHFEPKTIDLGTLAQQTLNEIKMIDKNHEYIIEKEEQSLVEVDTGLIKQLMRILIDNSIKYTPMQKTIHIKIYKTDENCIFRIQDEGQGISPEEVENIFDRFYRTDKSRNRNTGGSGLGLSIARWIVKKHRGNIIVLSRESLGTRTTVELPRKKENAPK